MQKHFQPYSDALARTTYNSKSNNISNRTALERVLWSTDFPYPNATHETDEADLVDLVPQFAPVPLAQQRLLVDNPARLYGFD